MNKLDALLVVLIGFCIGCVIIGVSAILIGQEMGAALVDQPLRQDCINSDGKIKFCGD